MRNTLKKIAVTTGVASAAVVLGAVPSMALAATTWTVSPNPAPFTAVSTNTVLSVSGIPLTCPTASAAGSAFSATGNPATVGNITSASFGTTSSPCTSALGPVTPVATTTPAWQLVAQDYTSGVTTGYIKNIQAKLTVLTCTFNVTGEVNAKYTNSTKKLSVSNSSAHQLTVSGATAACAGIVANGAHPTFTGDYSVTGITSIIGT
ncbi:hypothetical protein ACIQM0_17615 [Streptomyces sp. NPDC091387]|uniref:hypothetical protein n=1 Tax=unclassified Streptomyces TaxID=2593676 RepID=UPI0036584EC3